jgi:hypothetical protein
VLISSMASFASIVVLLVLFWMVFSIVGLHVFGGLKLDIPWPNMDSLINSMINSFHVSHCAGRMGCGGMGRVWVKMQGCPAYTSCCAWCEAQQLTAVAAPAATAPAQILNLENFQITMFSVIRATNYASSMFWLAWIIMGKFILLTLFLAVTLDAFERKYEVRCGVVRRGIAGTACRDCRAVGATCAGVGGVAGSQSGLCPSRHPQTCYCLSQRLAQTLFVFCSVAAASLAPLCCSLTSRRVCAARVWPAPCSAGSRRQGSA